MSIRSKMKFGGGLPVGGRSSGGRPKKKVKAKLTKSKARKKAESNLEGAKKRRERLKKEASTSGTVAGRTGQRRAKQVRQQARESESGARAIERKAGKETSTSKALKKGASSLRKTASSLPQNVGNQRAAAKRLKSKNKSPGIQASGKAVVKAKKKLAKTPRFGGRARVSSGNRNMFLEDVNPAKH